MITRFILLFFIFICCLYDIKTNKIPIVLFFSISILTALEVLISIIFNINIGFHFLSSTNDFYFTVFSLALSVLPGLILVIISKLFPNSLGMADALIITIIGIYFSIYIVLEILFISLVFSSLFSIFALIIKRNLHYTFAFVPFIFLGTAVSLCF